MRTAAPTALAAALLGLAVLVGCGDGEGPARPPAPGKADLLVGTWLAAGQDPTLRGTVEVRMNLRADGSLRVEVTDAGGASLVFPGTWSVLDDGRLRLRGAWFKPDGEVSVRCGIAGDDLVLEDDSGEVQSWVRVT